LRNSNGSSRESYNTKINAIRTRGLNPTKSHSFCAKNYPPETLKPNEQETTTPFFIIQEQKHSKAERDWKKYLLQARIETN
jgi:hypothetical protein